jgi:hypothetical protein
MSEHVVHGRRLGARKAPGIGHRASERQRPGTRAGPGPECMNWCPMPDA